jgi:uncharacterized damage-inducible protein DinB
MHSSITQIADQYKLQTGVIDRILDGVPQEHLTTRPDDKANSIRFILGHITHSRYAIAQLLGSEEAFAHGALFERGAKVRSDSEYPPFGEIKEAWDKISLAMPQLLEGATEEQLAAKQGFEPPGMENNLRGILTFLAFHEAYHIGQISYVRRLNGHAGPFG